MMLLDALDQCHTPSSTVSLPETRPSVLNPDLPCEPWIDACRCEPVLVLFLLNRPVALMPGSRFDYVSLNTLLNQLRHRAPRQSSSTERPPLPAPSDSV